MDPAVILVMPVRPLSLHNQRVRSRADVDVLGVEARQRNTCLKLDIFLFRFGIRCTGYLSLARNPVSHVGAIHTIALWNRLNRSGHSLRIADERSGKSYPPRETSEYPRMPLCSPYPRRCCLSGLWPLLSHTVVTHPCYTCTAPRRNPFVFPFAVNNPPPAKQTKVVHRVSSDPHCDPLVVAELLPY